MQRAKLFLPVARADSREAGTTGGAHGGANGGATGGAHGGATESSGAAFAPQ